MEDDNVKSSQKAHRARQSGRKADKKKSKNVAESDRQRNPKAFSIQSVRKTAKKVQRNFDLQTKRQHIPVVVRTQVEPPPVIVAVVGPPKVGKSTLIRSLVRNYTKQRLSQIHGPCTVVAGKKSRLTFIECPNDLCALIDVAKVADLILLLTDASQGFDMVTFELLTITKAHGEPRIIGVLTHLDTFKDKEKLRKTKKKLKDRYWKDLYKGAKLFYLSGVLGEDYPKNEVHNLSRFISVMSYRPLTWHSTHPYILADRMQDITNPEDIRQFKKCNRRVCLYGYIHGAHMRYNQDIHIPGCGNFSVMNMQYLPDPCPLPDREKRRSLNEKERLIYAPMSSVGGLIYDKDAMYIDVGGSHSYTQRTESDKKLVTSLQDLIKPAEEQTELGEVPLFSMSSEISSSGSDDNDEYSDKINNTEDNEESEEGEESAALKDESKSCVNFDGEDDTTGEMESEDQENDITYESDDGEAMQWKDNLVHRANKAMKERKSRRPNLMKLIYGMDESMPDKEEEKEEEDEIGGFLKIIKSKSENHGKSNINQEESKKDSPVVGEIVVPDQVTFREVFGRTRDGGELAAAKLKEDDYLYGDFEDLENKNDEDFEDDSGNEEKESSDDDVANEDELSSNEEKMNEDKKPISLDVPKKRKSEMTKEERRLAKKQRLKEYFDKLYDNKEDTSFYDSWKAETVKQAEMNKLEFQDVEDEQRVQIEGFRPGMYIRVEIDGMPWEFVEHHEPQYPIILGGVQSVEGNVGYVQARFKKHQWYKQKEVLKTQDPLIISAGWWRFQTMAYFSKLQDNLRHQYLKYSTRDYMYCHVTFWGPIMPQNTGFVAMQTVHNMKPFRIAGTGVILELDKAVNIEKKLKLVGSVSKIFKKSAFIEGMFNSKLEVAKFQGAAIRTQAGVRGIIKKAITEGPPGSFRATFEDKILKSDIIILPCWYTVELRQLYIPVTSLLMPVGEKSNWKGMRTVGELRYDLNIPVPVQKDSLYKAVNRPVQRFPELTIPKAIMKELPFKDTPKNLMAKDTPLKKVAVVRDSREKKVANLLERLKTLYQHKRKVDRLKMRQRAQQHQKQRAEIEDKKLGKQKLRKKAAYRILGKKQKQAREDD